MSVRVLFPGVDLGTQTKRAMNTHLSNVARATTGAAREVAKRIETQGRADIRRAGRFGPRWTEGLQATVKPKTGALLNAVVTVSHNISYFDIFEKGGTILGKPLLWIPLSYTRLTMSAREYAATFGGLFYVRSRSGLPLLLSIRDRKPKYFGVSSIHMPKKFHIEQVCTEVMKEFELIYTAQLKGLS
jgi:hypothetical protein